MHGFNGNSIKLRDMEWSCCFLCFQEEEEEEEDDMNESDDDDDNDGKSKIY